jgi:hypothetical protein
LTRVLYPLSSRGAGPYPVERLTLIQQEKGRRGGSERPK